MIKQITEKSIGHRIRFHLFYSPIRWIYFEVDQMPKNLTSLAEYLESVKDYPQGVYTLEATIENKIFQVQYDETKITDSDVIKFANALTL